MIKIDSGNNIFETYGDATVVLVEFVEIAIKISKMLSKHMNTTEKELLDNLFKTAKFAMEKKDLNAGN